MNRLAQLDVRYVWHPFTQMRDWMRQEPIVIVRGRGPVLWDAHGRKYLDANASIWTNLHGHQHPALNRALRAQLQKIAHSSALGLANEPAALLAAQLVRLARLREQKDARPRLNNPALEKVFFSDDGSTALEVALKLAYEASRRLGRSGPKPRFLGLEGAYHGDTVGAVSLGHIDLFHRTYAGLLFKSDAVMAPYCYRCPFNRAQPERADARQYRQCQWQCLGQLENRLGRARRRGQPYAAFVFEPLMQGAAGMIPQPHGWLRQAAALAREHGALLIADEVMTGFGRTGPLFACHREGVQPDFLALAKGLTGGYLPMAATLTTLEIFNAFLGEYAEFKTFFHGHSYTGNQLGAAAALASLGLLQKPGAAALRQRLARHLAGALQTLWDLPQVGDIRQEGLVAGIELVKDWRSREPFPLADRAGFRVCEAMARRGVLTRPIGNVLVLMPPYCVSPQQIEQMVEVLRVSVQEVLGKEPGNTPRRSR
ncbi:adenosylmethionine--8-amino-7-oxononanoate transaminase [Fontisphaera persica]|uniref:adenosylmethionine--8-amino-7-oxononanoate transaminase n=1 Tax=Fontisphaera persica TaxID=2974023 RepID=UPI0024BF1369|nr:adenosylmethionine--8-amino-7-oxononanoate transaminase [Fontisphaera persica]WCJ58591.1 adenosylmethionine--8-amino-7-oxononanoate transaminase [Fontisphaera persica]